MKYLVTVKFRTARPDSAGDPTAPLLQAIEAPNAAQAVTLYLARLGKAHPDIINLVVTCSIDHAAESEAHQ